MQKEADRSDGEPRLDGAAAKQGLGPVLLGVVVRAFGLYLVFQAVARAASLGLVLLEASRGPSSFSAGGLRVEAMGFAFLEVFGLMVGGLFILMMASWIVARAYSLSTPGRA
ncbi:MAG: hypothetical protein P1V81_03485 [Planctomycetota bacterium]|nr:hypothetical protein [Planctomycetota bacterium]